MELQIAKYVLYGSLPISLVGILIPVSFMRDQSLSHAEDVPDDQTGWDGQLALPRELYEQRITNVVNDARAQETGSWRIISNDTSAETVDLITLGQYPLREIVSAWEATPSLTEEVITLESTAGEARIESFNSTVSSRYFVLTASLAFPAAARDSQDLAAGFRILSSEFESTDIYYRALLLPHLHTVTK